MSIFSQRVAPTPRGIGFFPFCSAITWTHRPSSQGNFSTIARPFVFGSACGFQTIRKSWNVLISSSTLPEITVIFIWQTLTKSFQYSPDRIGIEANLSLFKQAHEFSPIANGMKLAAHHSVACSPSFPKGNDFFTKATSVAIVHKREN